MLFDKQNNLLVISEWSKYDIDSIIKAVFFLGITNIEYDCSKEPYPVPEINPKGKHSVLLEFVKQHKINFKMLLPCKVSEYTGTSSEWLKELSEYIKFYDDPFAFIIPTVQLTPTADHSGIKKYYFSVMSVRPRKHRCLFVDYLHKEGLEKQSFFTWNITQEQNGISIKNRYKFVNWEEKVKKDSNNLSSNFIEEDKFTFQFKSLPVEYEQSVLDIVLETTDECPFLTEKIWKPIFLKKPFLIVGSQNHHKKLEELGFKLHLEDIIDYSFDEESNSQVRIEKISLEMIKLLKFTKRELVNKTKEICIYNYKRLMQLYEDSYHLEEFSDEFNKIRYF